MLIMNEKLPLRMDGSSNAAIARGLYAESQPMRSQRGAHA